MPRPLLSGGAALPFPLLLLLLLLLPMASRAFAGRQCAEETRRIVLVKTHKTGSSTLANIIYRFGDRRGLKFMLPTDDLRLGWPFDFPGRYETHEATEERKQAEVFDVVAHHAVLHLPTMLRFVPGAKIISIVRDPGTQGTRA